MFEHCSIRVICSLFIVLLPDTGLIMSKGLLIMLYHNLNFLLGNEGILRLYPDLVERLAERGSLTQESFAEHKAAGLDKLTLEEKTLRKKTNAKYTIIIFSYFLQ